MNKLIYKSFVWPQNPDHYQMQFVREPVYQKNEAGETVFTGMGPMKRVITGSGSFIGPTAYGDFQELAETFSDATYGALVHPVFGSCRVYFTELQVTQQPRENYVAYKFEFREADEDGAIPQ